MEIDSGLASGNLLKVYSGIEECVKQIAHYLRYKTGNKISTNNDFGDIQLDLDLVTEGFIF